jgi:hypothetical protein
MDIKIKNVLAYLGVIPFLSLSIFILNEYKFNDGILISSIKSYGLVILSFLSGVYWGQHLSLKEKFSIFLALASNFIILLSWFSYLFLKDKYFILFLIISFSSLIIIERYIFLHKVISEDYFLLRFRVTMIVVLILTLLLVHIW